MNVIIPTKITETQLKACTILENEYSEWEAGGFVAVNTTNYNWRGITRASSGNMYGIVYNVSEAYYGVYKSTDNGVTWGLIAGSPSTNLRDICAFGTNIYVCGNSKIYMDTNESGTFSDLGAEAKKWTCLCLSTAGDVYCASTNAGIYKQTGGTGAFAQVNSTVRDYEKCCGAYDGSLYFGINYGGKIYRSADGGVSLVDLGAAAPSFDRLLGGLTADINGHIYAAGYGTDIYKRTNGTGNFVAIGGTALSWWGMCYDETTDTLYGCVYGGKVYSATGTTIYSIGDTVQETSSNSLADHKIYESLTNNNKSNQPSLDDGTNWQLVGNTNITKCLDEQISTQTTNGTQYFNDDCSSLLDWTDTSSGDASITVDPAGQFCFDTNTSATGDYRCFMYQDLEEAPDNFTLEVDTYFDALGTLANTDDFRIVWSTATWRLDIHFCSDGLYINESSSVKTEVGTNIVLCNASAAEQNWKFEVDKTGGESTATVRVFLDDVYQGFISCAYAYAEPTPGRLYLIQNGYANDNRIAHLYNVKIYSPSITYVFAPGEVEAISFLNLSSSSINIYEIDSTENVILNGDTFSGATGTTEPVSWNKIGTPSNFTVESGALRITADAAGEGLSQTSTVSELTEYQLLFLYKNTAGDFLQYKIEDMTNYTTILDTTDLISVSGDLVPHSYVFTTPADCISVKISFIAKNSGDVVWIDFVHCAPTEYNQTITTGSLVSYACKTDLVADANCLLTVVINNTDGIAGVGEIVTGTKYDIGGRSPDYGISWGGKDWSTIEADEFGHYEIVERDKSKWLKCAVDVPLANIDYVTNLLQGYMSRYLMWLASETYQAQMIYGFADEWSFQQDEPAYAKLTMSITGIT